MHSAELTFEVMCGILLVSRGGSHPTEGKRIGLDELLDTPSVRMGCKCLCNLSLPEANFLENNFKKPLDKSLKMWYNKGTKGVLKDLS